jgi:Tfp pilus assembly protein PilV
VGPIEHRRRITLREEAGFGLVEVLVSAVLVVLVSLGVYAGLDGASATSGVNKHRSVATEIAQQDQDRMRAMTVNELSNYRDSQTTTVGGIVYTVASRADWITDSTGSASCTSGTAQANYLRIASSVTWPNMPVPPVTVESITAPASGSFSSTQGSLAVQVRDRNGNPVQGATVALSGTKSYTDVTNAGGCVLWGYLPAGSGYTVTVSKAGYVDKNGVAAPSQSTSVVGEATNTVAFDYDQGGTIQGVYQTWNGSSAIPANGLSFMATNPNLTVALPIFGDNNPHTSFTTGLLYPHTVAYTVWAGGCNGANPTTYGLAAQSALVTPGGVTSVNLREPPINFQVVNGSTPVNNATVRFTATAAGCSGTVSRTTDSTGFIADKAFPYGTYTFCYQSGTTKKVTAVSGATTLTNTSATGIAAGTAAKLDIASGFTSGTCP